MNSRSPSSSCRRCCIFFFFFPSSMQIFEACLFCVAISCRVVIADGSVLLWWLMFALIGSASQHVAASIWGAQPQISVGKEQACSAALHLSDLADDWLQQATGALLVFYLRFYPCCGHTAVSDLTFANYLLRLGKFTWKDWMTETANRLIASPWLICNITSCAAVGRNLSWFSDANKETKGWSVSRILTPEVNLKFPAKVWPVTHFREFFGQKKNFILNKSEIPVLLLSFLLFFLILKLWLLQEWNEWRWA